MEKISYSEKLKDPELKFKHGIYKLIINNKCYIGSAVNIFLRLRAHLNSLTRGDHSNRHLQAAFNLSKDIDFEILEVVDDKINLIAREQFYIDTLHPSYNICPIAGSQLGFKHSDKTKKWISKIQKGKKCSEERKREMSIVMSGRKLSEVHKKSISLSKIGDKNPFFKAGEKHPQFGFHRSDLTKSKISESLKKTDLNKGENNHMAKSGVIYDVETNLNHLFWSLKSKCREMGLNYKGVFTALSQNRFYKGRFYVDFVVLPFKKSDIKS